MQLGKRGVEQPQVIIYIVYTVILALAGIYVAWSYLGGVDVEVDFNAYTIQFNSLATRLVGTPECFALEDRYLAPADNNAYFDYPRFGIISRDKLPGDRRVNKTCVSQEKQFWLALSTIDGAYTHIDWNCPAGDKCTAPNPRDWPARKYPVLFYDGSVFKLAMLEVKLSP